jgi:putative FmdB family regulatory protein
MPLYEYQCEACSHHFTLLQSVRSDTSETVCPQCGASKNHRLFSTFAMKGAGQNEPPASGPGGCGTGGCGCH